MEGVWSPEERYPGSEISFSYLAGQGFISGLLLIAHHAKNCDPCPGWQEPSEQNDRNPLGKVFSSIFIFCESLISPAGNSSSYFKLTPLEKKYIPRDSIKNEKNLCMGWPRSFHCIRQECRPGQIKHSALGEISIWFCCQSSPGERSWRDTGDSLLQPALSSPRTSQSFRDPSRLLLISSCSRHSLTWDKLCD